MGGQYYTLHRKEVLGLPGRTCLANGEGVLGLTEDVDVRRLVGEFHTKNGVVGIKGKKRTIFLHHPKKEQLDDWISDICQVAGTQEAAIPASATSRLFS